MEPLPKRNFHKHDEDVIQEINLAYNTIRDTVNEIILEFQLMKKGLMIHNNFNRDLLILIQEFTKNKKVIN